MNDQSSNALDPTALERYSRAFGHGHRNVEPKSNDEDIITGVANPDYTRAFGDGPRNFEPWSSDADDGALLEMRALLMEFPLAKRFLKENVRNGRIPAKVRSPRSLLPVAEMTPDDNGTPTPGSNDA
ncbi:hypothetical protein TNCV_1989221 [Trichonephila clavipes]|nr:hypothetical protein TNCV_1989221 [Trichonephila clavipes]